MQAWFVLAVAAGYVTTLFLIAWWGDRRSVDGPLVSPKSWAAAVSYCLTLAVYNTSWSFYGSVGRAATSGLDFATIYIGPTLVLLFGQPLLSKVIAIAKAQNVTSIADFIAARYGKSQVLAAFVTLASLLGVLPYIALQLKAVGKSFDYLILQPERAGGEALRFWQDSAFGVAASMALFAIVFGVRHVHASEHHRGLMLAIAFESVVKLVAFLVVALFVLFGLSGGPAALVSQFGSDPQLAGILAFDPAQPVWPSTIIISAIAFLCLPQAFHVAVVENESPGHTRTAAWLYPTYLALFSLLILPIAAAGLTRFGAMMDPDTYVISLPIAADAGAVSLIAFLGGLSAATGMVIMTSVALSTMLCNDVIMPLLLRSSFFGLRAQSRPVTSVLMTVRRLSILGILLLAYLMHRLVNQAYPLTVIGLLSFVAVAQFGPAFVGGLFWQRANKIGASVGIAAGFFIWAYTLLLPSAAPLWPAFAEIVRNGPWQLALLKPNALFGLEGLDPISHATLWSLAANLACFLVFSVLGRQTTVERNQAAAFADGVVRETVPKLSSRVVIRLDDLRALARRFVGAERGAAAFDGYLAARMSGTGPRLDPSGLVDLELDPLHRESSRRRDRRGVGARGDRGLAGRALAVAPGGDGDAGRGLGGPALQSQPAAEHARERAAGHLRLRRRFQHHGMERAVHRAARPAAGFRARRPSARGAHCLQRRARRIRRVRIRSAPGQSRRRHAKLALSVRAQAAGRHGARDRLRSRCRGRLCLDLHRRDRASPRRGSLAARQRGPRAARP